MTRPVMIAANSLPLREVRDRIQSARAAGMDELWLEQLPQERDSSILAAEFLHTAPTTRVGTAILPMYLRHPVATAQLAATMAELSDGRFALGLGLSNPFVNDYMLGCAQGPPLRVVREYATIVRTLLREGSVEFEGKHFTARIRYDAPLEHEVPVYLAGMRAKMIKLAVELGDGLLLWLCSSRYVREIVVPAVRQACAEFDKSPADFPILAVVLVRSGEDRAQAKRSLQSYAMIPYYQRYFAAQGFTPADYTRGIGDHLLDEIMVIGDGLRIKEGLDAYTAAGCTPIPCPATTTLAGFNQILADLTISGRPEGARSPAGSSS
jgi:5,10-methylenetetrahydromethanopterin reductase